MKIIDRIIAADVANKRKWAGAGLDATPITDVALGHAEWEALKREVEDNYQVDQQKEAGERFERVKEVFPYGFVSTYHVDVHHINLDNYFMAFDQVNDSDDVLEKFFALEKIVDAA